MTKTIEALAGLCIQRNGTVRRSMNMGAVSLDAYVRMLAETVHRNNQISPLLPKEDFYEEAGRYAQSLLGEAAAGQIREALACGVICTADHHGAMYCSQSFQGDLLFSFLLKELAYGGTYVPILSAGQVELENATYARGISAYTSAEEKQLFPLFPAKHSVQLSSHAAPVDGGMIDRFRKRFVEKEDYQPLKNTLDGICREIYGDPRVLSAPDFAVQTTAAGEILSHRLFAGDDGPVFAYLEIEEAVLPLLLKEMEDGSSLIRLFLTDPDMRRGLSKNRASDGSALADHLFRCTDEKGRKISLTLTPEGVLSGRDWNKDAVEIKADPGILTEMLITKKLLPGIFTTALILQFERGITWMGGQFQSLYLPEWQSLLKELLTDAGLSSEGALIGSYDCTGYISGPMFALYPGCGFSTTAGPVEMWMLKPSVEQIRELIRKTSLRDSHLIGLSEMYFDLVLRNEREENWYRLIAEDLYSDFPANRIEKEE